MVLTMDTLSRTVQSPLFSLLLALVTVFSVVLSFIFYFRSRRAKEPCWAIHSNNLVRDFRAKLPDLNIQYGNEEVENLTVAKVLFWNRGGGTINSDDIAEGDPLRVEATGALRILDAKILQANSPASQFKVRLDRDRNALFLEFDFLDKNHGALLQLIHSGTSSTDLVVKGTVKGGGTPKRKELPQAISRERVLYLLGVSGMWLMTLS
ncbi:MAG: hypothetical protein U1B94_06535, partial [candidate division NC10 bacterium]|nr:hypothetical protein [candidate division NC10 bacterium]